MTRSNRYKLKYYLFSDDENEEGTNLPKTFISGTSQEETVHSQTVEVKSPVKIVITPDDGGSRLSNDTGIGPKEATTPSPIMNTAGGGAIYIYILCYKCIIVFIFM